MAKQILSGAKLYLDGYDQSGDHNAIALAYGADVVDITAIGDTNRNRLGGLRTVSASHAGFWEGGTDKVDDVDFARMGQSVITTIAPTTGSEGERAFFTTMEEASYSPGGSIGDAFAFQIAMEGMTDLYRGTVLQNAGRTASGTGNGYNLGNVIVTQKVAAALHVIGISGTGTPSLTVKVQSDDNSGFTTPQDRIVFTTRTTIGAEILTLAGPLLTETWWRVVWTITGGTPGFTFVVSVAIQ